MNYFTIYKIQDYTTPNCYIGSTKNNVSVRLSRHKSYIKNNEYCSSSIILNNRNYEVFIIDTGYGDYKTRKEIERYYINNTPNCINKRKLNFDKKEWSKQIVHCDCGTTHTRGCQARHQRSKKHQDYLASLHHDNES